MDIKYFWKHLKFDSSNFTVSPCNNPALIGSMDHFEISSQGFTMEHVEQSPVALSAQYGWKLISPFLQEKFEKSERMKFITELIHSVHEEIKTCDTTWFRFVFLHFLRKKEFKTSSINFIIL